MKRQLPALLLALCLALPLPALGAESTGFSDVSPDDWFAPYVAVCVEEGLMKGTGEDTFSPHGTVTAAEAATLAARLHHLQRGGDGTLPAAPEDWGRLTLTFADGETYSFYRSDFELDPEVRGDGWYSGGRTGGLLYFSRAQGWDGRDYQRVSLKSWTSDAPIEGQAEVINNVGTTLHFIPDEFEGDYDSLMYAYRYYTTPPSKWWRDTAYYLMAHELEDVYCNDGLASRIDLAQALDLVWEQELERINHIDHYPDSTDLDREAVLRLYNAGILTGTDSLGSFSPNGTLTRAEMAAMAARLLRPELRVSFSPEEPAYQSYTLTPMELPEGADLSNCEVLSSHVLYLSWNDQTKSSPVQVLLRSDGSLLELPQDAQLCLYNNPSGNPEPYPLVGFEKEDPAMPGGYVYSLMDSSSGKMVLPFGPYATHNPVEDGQRYVTKVQPWDRTEWTPTLLWDRAGTLIRELPDRMETEIPWESLGSGLAPTYDPASGLYGYVDMDNSWAIPPQYDNAYPFTQGRALVCRETGWGVIDPQGREILPCQYPSLTYRGGGLYRTEEFDGTDFWLREDGTTFQNSYTSYSFRCVNGYFALSNKYLDRDFQYATPGVFDWTGPIGADGSGFVGMDGKLFRIQFSPLGAQGTTSVDTPSGKDPSSPSQTRYTLAELEAGRREKILPEMVEEGFLTFSTQGSDGAGRYTLLTKDGRLRELGTDKPCQSGGPLLVLERKEPDKWWSLYGVMDTRSFEMVLPFASWGWEWYSSCELSEDGEYILTGDPETYAAYLLWDAQGNQLQKVDASTLDWWSGFHQELRPTQVTEYWKGEPPFPERLGLWGYVTPNTYWAIPPLRDSVQDFRDGYAVVGEKAGADGGYDRMGAIDREGKEVIPLKYHRLDNCGEGMFLYTMFTPDGQVEQRGMVRAWDGLEIPYAAANDQLDFHSGYSGYTDVAKDWSPDIRYVYVNTRMETVSQPFDWVGPIGDDGAGFVGLEGKVYRIQFEP